MRACTIYEVLEPTTSAGYRLKVSTIYMTFNEDEYKKLHNMLREKVGTGLITDVNIDEVNIHGTQISRPDVPLEDS